MTMTGQSYAGDVTSRQAWEILKEDETAVLVENVPYIAHALDLAEVVVIPVDDAADGLGADVVDAVSPGRPYAVLA